MAGGERAPGSIVGAWARLKVSLFGFDAFISYAHKDGLGYAMALENCLEARDYTVFRDVQEMPAGTNLRAAIQRGLRRSRVLIVVDTPGARASTHVRSEVADFGERHRHERPIIGLRLGEHEDTWPDVEDRVYVNTDVGEVDPPKPSEAVLSRIADSDRRLRVNQVARYMLGLGIASLLVLAVLLGMSRGQAKRASERAESNQRVAEANQRSLEANQKALQANKQLADERMRLGFASSALLAARGSLPTCSSLAAGIAALAPGSRTPIALSALIEGFEAGWCPSMTVTYPSTKDTSLQDATFALNAERFVTTATTAAMVSDHASHKTLGRITTTADKAFSTSTISRDGTRVVTLFEDGPPLLWNADTGSAIASLDHVGKAVNVAAGDDVFVTSGDRGTWVWNATTGALVKKLRSVPPLKECMPPDGTGWGHDGCAASFSRDGRRAVTSSGGAQVFVWDTTTWRELRVLDAGTFVYQARISDDGRRVVVRVGSGFRALEVDSDRRLAVTVPSITEVALSPDGLVVATGTDHGSIALWRMNGERVGASFGHVSTLDFDSAIVGLTCTSFCARLISDANDGTARVWDAMDGRQIAVLARAKGIPSAVAPSRTSVITASDDSTFSVWEAPPAQRSVPFAAFDQLNSSLARDPESRLEVAVSPDARTALVRAGTTLHIVDLETRTRRASVPIAKHGRVAAFSPDSTMFVLTDGLGGRNASEVVKVYQMDGVVRGEPTLPKGQVYDVYFDRQSRRLAIPHSAQFWLAVLDLQTQRLQMISPDEYISHPTFDVDGSHLLTKIEPVDADGNTSRSEIWTWDLGPDQPTVVHRLPLEKDSTIDTLRVIDDEHFISGYISPSTFFDTAPPMISERDTGLVTAALEGHGRGAVGLAISSTYERLVTTSYDRTARLWDRSGKSIAVLRGHGSLPTASFSVDGRRLLTTDDRSARVWNAADGELLVTYPLDAPVVAALTTDGSRIIALRSDRLSFGLVLDELVVDAPMIQSLACDALARTLTTDDDADKSARAVCGGLARTGP